MKKRIVRRYKKTRIAILSILIFVILMGMFRSFNHYLEPQLHAIAQQHTGFAINNIVKEVLADMEYDSDALYKIEKNEEGEITDITFDSYQLNQIQYASLNTVDEALLAAQDGKKDPKTKNIFFEDGVVYEIPAGYLTQIFFLYDKGPMIKVRMRMMNHVRGEIQTVVESYGINNIKVEIDLVIHVKAQVVTSISASTMESSCTIPLVIQIINGNVPTYMPNYE